MPGASRKPERPTGPVVTPDGRYFVVHSRLWRRSDPALGEAERARLVGALMDARRSVKAALAAGDDARLAAARVGVDAAKVALGERGPVWWTDGSPDHNRRPIRNTPYAEWFDALPASVQGENRRNEPLRPSTLTIPADRTDASR